MMNRHRSNVTRVAIVLGMAVVFAIILGHTYVVRWLMALHGH